ncbi:MAG: two-component system, NtrC family, sensor kinase, partial [Desulfovibrionales bacterium]|nr:two-component system, NtrC family, sensor kinase [Desulfovibrionales bacterium]
MRRQLGVEAIQIIQKVVNTSNDLLSYVDADHIYCYVNDRHIQFWGKPREEIVGKSVAELLGDEIYAALVQPKLDQCFAGETVHYQSWFTSADQGPRYMDVSYFGTMEHGKVVGVIMHGHDITELRLANQKLEDALATAWSRAGEVETLLDCSRIVLEAKDFPTAARRIFDSCRSLVGAVAGYVALLSSDGAASEIIVPEIKTNRRPEAPCATLPIRGLLADAYGLGKALYENDCAGSACVDLTPEESVKLDNILLAPLKIDEQTVGVMVLANKKDGFTPKDQRLATAFSEFAAVTLRNSRAKEALEQSEQQLTMALDAASMGTWVWDLQGGGARRGANLAVLIQDDERTLEADHPIKLFGKIHPDDLPALQAKLDTAVQEEGVFEDEYRVLDEQGACRWMRNKGRVLPGDSGTHDRMAGAVADITERRRIEEALRESESRYRSLSADLPVLVCTYLPDSTLTYVNTAYAKFVKRTPEELLGKAWLDFMPKADREARRKGYMSLTPDNPLQTNEQLSFDQGVECWREWTDKAFFDDNGAIVSLQAVGVDITHRKHAEEQVLESEATLRNILNALQAAILIIDPRTMTVVDVNEFGEKLFGESKAALLGRRCQTLPWLSDCGKAVADCPLLHRAVFAQEFRIQRPDGKITPISKTVITSKLNGAPHLYEILLDLTRQKDMERQLTHAQKMESIGQLAAGIAHEINTPSQYVGDNLYFLQQAFVKMQNMLETVDHILESCHFAAQQAYQEAKTDAKLDFLTKQIPRAIDQSLDGTSRVGSIVRAMKKFSHPDNEEKRPTDINSAIENTTTVARNEWKYHAEMKLELSPDLPAVPCYPGDLNMALLNIVVNAAHAIGEKFAGTEEKGLITIRSSLHEGFVDIAIEDTGTGVPAKHQKRIFDPFFTTKEV